MSERMTTDPTPTRRPARWALAPAPLAVLALAAVLAAGALISPGTGAAFAVGYVDTEAALRAHPKFTAVQEQVQQYQASRQAALAAYEGRTLTEAEKRDFFLANETIRYEVALKEQELLAPLAEDLERAIAAIGRESGVEVILEKAAVHFGGLDLTPAVLGKMRNP